MDTKSAAVVIRGYLEKLAECADANTGFLSPDYVGNYCDVECALCGSDVVGLVGDFDDRCNSSCLRCGATMERFHFNFVKNYEMTNRERFKDGPLMFSGPGWDR
jgi:hypothetical protein